MAQLTAEKARAFKLGDTEEYPVIAAGIIYEGSLVGENASGYARQLVAADPFLGVALETVDNTGGAAGAKSVKVRTMGVLANVPIASIAITANDRPLAYASDGDTFTLTSASNSRIGSVRRFVSTGFADVEFNAHNPN